MEREAALSTGLRDKQKGDNFADVQRGMTNAVRGHAIALIARSEVKAAKMLGINRNTLRKYFRQMEG
jgi:DNA-binding protein Fis